MSHTALIALDWGTSSLRAYRMDASGQLLDTRSLPWGVMNLPTVPDAAAQYPCAAFEQAFGATCGDWLAGAPGPAVVACGMVGSAQGWQEAAYLETPTTLDGLARRLTVVHRDGGTPLHIVPGLIQRTALPNVMRGEETQVLGVLADRPAPPEEPLLIGLPGTHSKWVRVQSGEIEGFDTFMTGEVFAALRSHTILGQTMRAAEQPDHAAFVRGLEVAQSADAELGISSNIFSTRTLGLTGALPASAQADYLSGLLIGHELAALARRCPSGTAPRQVILCGQPDLCRRYAQALEHFGWGRPHIAEHATPRGLWQIARAAGLVPSAQPPNR